MGSVFKKIKRSIKKLASPIQRKVGNEVNRTIYGRARMDAASDMAEEEPYSPTLKNRTRNSGYGTVNYKELS